MKKSKLKIMLNICLSAILTAGCVSPLGMSSVKAEETGKVVPVLSPNPKQMTVKGEGFTFGSAASIIGEDKADEYAVKELKETLQKNYIQVSQTEKDAVQIYIGEDGKDEDPKVDEALNSLKAEGATSLKDEGYVIAIGKDSKDNKKIVVEGKDKSGTFYGVQTLKQIIKKDSNDKVIVPSMEIRDEPAMKLRGTIEGFYGDPWSHKDRLSQVDFYGNHKMNTYIYAPKEDPYHRSKWKEPYPQDKIKEFSELFNKSKENHVNFVFAISPGLTINLNDNGATEEDYKALEAKCQAMYDLGVRSFMICFDDIDYENPTARNPKGQSALLNKLQKEFVETHKDVTPLITVPTVYFNDDINDTEEKAQYTKIMAQQLDPKVIVMWTGSNWKPTQISYDDMMVPKNIYNRKAFVWFNYPVSDFFGAQEKVFLGPIENVDKNLDDITLGFLSNPMRYAEISKISVHTMADYAWNTKAYNKEKAWDNALTELGGNAKESLSVFAHNSCASVLNGFKQSEYLQAPVNEFWKQYSLDSQGSFKTAANKLSGEFQKIQVCKDDLNANLPDKTLVEQSQGFLTKTSLLGEAAKNAVAMLNEYKYGDKNNAKGIKHGVEATLEEARAVQVMGQGSNGKNMLNAKIAEPVEDFVVKALEEVKDLK